MSQERDPAEWEAIEQTRFRVLAGNPFRFPADVDGLIGTQAAFQEKDKIIVVNHRKALTPDAIVVAVAKHTQGELVLETVRDEPNHAGALAGAFGAVDALGRAESYGRFTYPHPVAAAIFEARRRAEDAIHAIITDGRATGKLT